MSTDLEFVLAVAGLDELTFAQEWDSLDAAGRAQLVGELERLERALEDPTPGHLAQRLDAATIQTPALALIDAHLVQLRDAVSVMYARERVRLRVLRERLEAGMDEAAALRFAIAAADAEVEGLGIDRLIVSMPPQEGKSERISRYGVLWLLRQFPRLRVALVSYDGANAAQFSYKVRADVTLYDGTSGNVDLGLRLAPDQGAVSRFMLTSGGSVYAIGIGGGLTGRPVEVMLIDDPVKDYRAADSVLQSELAWQWWQTVARPRMAPWGVVGEVATRWHELDLAGRMRAQQLEDETAGTPAFDRWTIVNVPALADHDPAKGEVDPLGREPGEWMLSARGRTDEQWAATRASLSERQFDALYQGRPSAGHGNVWQDGWWRWYSEPLWRQGPAGEFLLDGFDVTISIDCAFKDTKASDYVVLEVWAKKGPASYLVTVVRARLSFPATLDACHRLLALFPRARRKFIEAKANGDAVISVLRKEVAGVIGVNPDWASKEARAEAVAPFIRAGDVWLPEPSVASFAPELAFDVEAFVDECSAFPRGAHDDQVDACSQYLAEVYLRGGSVELTIPGEVLERLPQRTQTAAPQRIPVAGLGAMQERLARRALRG